MNEARTRRREATIAAWANSDWDDVARFIGPNAERFASAWEKARTKMTTAGGGLTFTWCWPALFFGFAWFLYRKQWAVGVVLIILPLVIGYFFSVSAGGGAAIFIAMIAKSTIAQDAVTKIAKIRAAGGGNAEIAAAGGVSVMAGVLGGILLLVELALGLIAAVMDQQAHLASLSAV
ncbi:DUF2628 domain-containing protein [Sphingomonas sp. R86521]|uniref:DUF2628 domain-containing protein n=1 Tax=Sphingomonas sp. R86521 TaxID=3093860 RepID=UPI0036D34FB7